jgi:hypothetical protein
MRRRTRGESIDRIRLDRLFAELWPLREKCLRWAVDNAAALRMADPMVPGELDDRECDNWRPLLAIAELATGDWVQLARTAARKLSDEPGVNQLPGERLLADLHGLFAELRVKADGKISSEVICKHLVAMEGRPWAGSENATGITQNTLANLLRPFGIAPKSIRTGRGPKDTAKGYDRSDFNDAFARYVDLEKSAPGAKAAANPAQRHTPDGKRASGDFSSVTTNPDVTDRRTHKPAPTGDCDGVPGKNGGLPSRGGADEGTTRKNEHLPLGMGDSRGRT